MHNFLKILLILFIFFFSSCKNQLKESKQTINGQELKSLVEESLKGDERNKNKLEGLFTFISDDYSKYNKIFIDSILIDSKTFYSILIEHQNPIYNLFAVVDKELNLYLKDESLNGYLNSNWKKSGSKIFAVVDEEFKSKDVIELKRISYYNIDELSCTLAFRQFTKIKTQEKLAEQNIVFISDTSINTEIVESKRIGKSNVKDAFRFDVAKNQYLSSQNKFDKLVLNEINNSIFDVKGLQITDAESIRRMLGIEKDSSMFDSTLTITDNDFEIKLDNQWKKLGSFTISNLLKKEMKGFKFINTKIGAGISIFKINPQDSLESYFDKTLITQSKENKKQRVSDKFEDTKNKYKLFEYSCPTKKLILILESPKSTYENYLDTFNNIFKSFLIKC